ncbi:MAG TPA: NAD(P)H-dependent oxidoreductase [Steroidobacteraceae bacterium]|jgi:chromate reductase
MQHQQIGIIVGSLREGSYTRMMARSLVELAPASMRLEEIAIGDLAHYNQDRETATPPPGYTEFRNKVGACAGILFLTPEYNRSIPGVLKNALDVGSRPWGKSVWNGKPAAVISVTPGALGAMAAHHHLRQILYALNVAAMPHPEAYIPAAATLFDTNGQLTNVATREFLSAFLRSFETWISRFSAPDA